MGAIASFKRGLGRLLGRSKPVGPGQERASSYYDQMFVDQQIFRVHYTKSIYYFLWSVIADRIENSGIRGVLEIGCGPGQLGAMLMDRGLERYHGMDFGPKAIEMARGNCPRGHFEVGDARTTDLHSRIDHDLVICTEVLEHIEDDLGVLSAFKPGVRCMCTVPNFPHESHVRRFESRERVIERYGPFFDEIKVSVWTSANWQDDRFYLIDGRRSTYRSA